MMQHQARKAVILSSSSSSTRALQKVPSASFSYDHGEIKKLELKVMKKL
jgi:hypothetical protein